MQYLLNSNRLNRVIGNEISTGQSSIKFIYQLLIILLWVNLGFSLLLFITGLAGLTTRDEFFQGEEEFQIIESIILFLYNGFGLLVTYKFHRIGLRLFAWMGIILVSIAPIIVIIYQYIRFRSFTSLHKNLSWLIYLYAGYLINVWFHLSLIMILIIKFVFQLIRFINTNQNL
ncbi:hypothetical protein I4U23_027431 [Adineta vaga]|nr:hypothetical protein I4U23_027431 [Adineta vaga]